MIEVVAALIWDGDRFLACQRPAHKTRGLLWEFVGGKVEPGETHQEALIRECREELCVTVSVGSVFMDVTHTYPDITVHLTLFNSTIVAGEPKLLEHNALAWVKPKEIDNMEFCPADVDILQKLKNVRGYLDANLIALADPAYKAFQGRLMPDTDHDRILGVRMPVLRKFAKSLDDAMDVASFMGTLPHRYFEEDNLHALFINNVTEYSDAVTALDRFLPYIDNWATCDMLTPKAFSSRPEGLLEEVKTWLSSTGVYTRRFGIGVLMKFYLGTNFEIEQLNWVLNTRRDAYYVKMMVAWYFATALAMQYDAAIKILQNCLLDPWTHNKTIQKAIESNRISSSQKTYLRTLRIHMKEGNNYA